MFFEVHRGLVGLGAMTVYRTAAESATDIEQFGKDVGPIAAQGGLLTQQFVFKYSVSQGRLQALQQEITKLQDRIRSLQQQLEAKVRELEKLGVAGVGDYLKMAAKTTVSYFLPIFSVFSFMGLDVFGGDGKKKRAEQLTKEAEALVTQMQYWNGRVGILNAEGEALAKAVEGGEKAISVQLIATPQHQERAGPAVSYMADLMKGPQDITKQVQAFKTMKTVTTKEPTKYGVTVFQTAEELGKRVGLQPSGDRLPVGFQTIYSPVLEHGRIVAKVPQINTTLPGPVDRRVVYGGLLSGVDTSEAVNMVVTGALIVGILWYFVSDLKQKK